MVSGSSIAIDLTDKLVERRDIRKHENNKIRETMKKDDVVTQGGILLLAHQRQITW